MNNIIAINSTVVNSKSIPKSSPVPSYIIPNILIDLIDNKVSTNTLAIKHLITSDYSILNSNSLTPLCILFKSYLSGNFC